MGRSLQPPQCSVIFHSSAVQTRGSRAQGARTRSASESACSSSPNTAEAGPRTSTMVSFQVLAML